MKMHQLVRSGLATAPLVFGGQYRRAALDDSLRRLRAAVAVSSEQGLPRCEIIQPHYDLYDRAGFESGLAEVTREQDLGVVSHFDARGLKLLEVLREVAAGLSATLAQVALAWLRVQPTVTAPIASATSLEQLDDIIQAAPLVLPAAALERLAAASR